MKPKKKSGDFNKILISIVILIALGISAYTYLQNAAITKRNSVSFIYIDKAFDEIINTLASPENCLASLGKRNAINDNRLTKLQSSGSDFYVLKNPLQNSDIIIEQYILNSTPTELKNNNANLTINFKDSKNIIAKKARLYVEVDKEDNIVFCHTLSSSSNIATKTSAVSLRVVHVSAEGISAKQDGVRTSIAVATCPKEFLLTGCSGAINGCGAPGESIRKMEPQALSPNSCEVWADATPLCPIKAKALAICTRVIY